MKKIWVKIDPWDKKLATTALEGGADGIMIPEGFTAKAKELGRIETIAPDGDLVPGEDVIFFSITDGSDEDEIARLCRTKKVVVESTDWTVIPLENLIAKGADVIASVKSREEAETAFTVLERGVGDILVSTNDVAELKSILSGLRETGEKTDLVESEIIEIRPVGMGDRVCVDTCTTMKTGEGMLAGNSSNAMFLVHAESVSNPYVAPRPFRINAGAVHAYVKVPGGRTRYLSELSAGDQILLTDYKGRSVPGTVGRLKIERRPMMLVRAEACGREISAIVQNAETIRLTAPDGNPVSVVSLRPGDKVMAALEEGARHFGYKIEETITEK